jgi:hypothetical protein
MKRLKCLVCKKPLDGTDFYCSFGCAFSDTRKSVRRLENEYFQNQRFSQDCEEEKWRNYYDDIYSGLNNL